MKGEKGELATGVAGKAVNLLQIAPLQQNFTKRFKRSAHSIS